MTRTRQHISYILCFMFAICPILAKASSCQGITNTINEDITKYSNQITNQHLPWMNITWLEKQLGHASTKKTSNGNMQFEWRCESEGSFLVADVDSNGNLISVNGQYNSDNGSGLFAIEIPPNKPTQTVAPVVTQLATPSAPIPQPILQPEKLSDAKCKSIISDIRLDLAKYSNSIQSQNLPWMKMSWLQQELGQPSSITTTYDYVYKWRNYRMFVGADGSKAELGTPPKGLQVQTYADASAILGRPQKTFFEKLAVNRWECPAINSSSLSVLSGNKNVLTSIMGRDCSGETCNMFFSFLAGSDLKRNFIQYVSQQSQVNATVVAAKLRNYNDNYRTSFQNQEELDTDVALKIKNYYASLRACRPGIYQYALPVLHDFLYHTSVINPQKNGRCMVKTSYVIPQIGKVDLKCNYQPQSLQLFTDAEAVAALSSPPANSEHASELQKVTDNECKRYIDGVL